MNEPREIDLTPNYRAIFRTMTDELKRQGKAEHLFADLSEAAQSEGLREFQRILAPLAMALNSATSVVEIEELRGVVTDMLTDVDRTAAGLERELAEDREGA